MARKKGSFTARTKARKRAADVIFEAEQRGLTRKSGALLDLLQERVELSAAHTPLPAYSEQIVRGLASDLRQVDALIEKRSDIADLDRLPGVDLAIMRVAVWEMLANAADVDPVVAIDEAVAISKSLSTHRSPAFVNAVLDAIRKDLADSEDAREPASGAELAQSSEDEELWDELLDEY